MQFSDNDNNGDNDGENILMDGCGVFEIDCTLSMHNLSEIYIYAIDM